MLVKIKNYVDNWQSVKDSCMTTIGKTTGKYPNDIWKKKMLLCEHSPIRKLKFNWRWEQIKYWVSVHFVRHKVGIEHWISTQRSDRTGVERDEIGQGALVNHECEADAQALITMGRKRLCKMASPETRQAMIALKGEIALVDEVIAKAIVPECIYRGYCYEYNTCGWYKTDEYKKQLEEYRKDIR